MGGARRSSRHKLSKAVGLAGLAVLICVLLEDFQLILVVPQMPKRTRQSETDYDCWEKARVDPEIDPEDFVKVRTVFGYGSLIFRPGFPYRCMYPASVKGFVRRFWQRSCDHRGTPERPGRVLALLRADAVADMEGLDVVAGMAYEVEEKDWPSVIDALDIRERHGYTRTLAQLHPVGDKVGNADDLGKAVVFFAHEPEKSAAYTGPEPIETTASVIADASGPSGPNDEYLFSLLDAMQSHGLPPDAYLTSLCTAVQENLVDSSGQQSCNQLHAT